MSALQGTGESDRKWPGTEMQPVQPGVSDSRRHPGDADQRSESRKLKPKLLTKDLFHRLSPKARILFVRLRSMGDCLLLTSPLRALKEEFPEFRVTILVESRFAGCFDGNPDVDEILIAGRKHFVGARL